MSNFFFNLNLLTMPIFFDITTAKLHYNTIYVVRGATQYVAILWHGIATSKLFPISKRILLCVCMCSEQKKKKKKKKPLRHHSQDFQHNQCCTFFILLVIIFPSKIIFCLLYITFLFIMENYSRRLSMLCLGKKKKKKKLPSHLLNFSFKILRSLIQSFCSQSQKIKKMYVLI